MSPLELMAGNNNLLSPLPGDLIQQTNTCQTLPLVISITRVKPSTSMYMMANIVHPLSFLGDGINIPSS